MTGKAGGGQTVHHRDLDVGVDPAMKTLQPVARRDVDNRCPFRKLKHASSPAGQNAREAAVI
jgi:hypothetical protein